MSDDSTQQPQQEQETPAAAPPEDTKDARTGPTVISGWMGSDESVEAPPLPIKEVPPEREPVPEPVRKVRAPIFVEPVPEVIVEDEPETVNWVMLGVAVVGLTAMGWVLLGG